jgi:hypothetical protein
MEVALEMLRGKTREEAEATIAERIRINEEAYKLEGKPVEEWPQFVMDWDTHQSCYHFSQDGAENLNGIDVTLMWMTVAELDAVLQDWNLRTPEEIWSIGNKHKAARVIVHCSEGRKLSPVWVCPTMPGKLGLVGGNHRLAVARTKGETDLPIIFHTRDTEAVARLFPARASLR